MPGATEVRSGVSSGQTGGGGASHVRGSPAHAPAVQRSALVQGSPSSQLAPSSGSYTHSPSTQAPMAVKQRPGGLSQASGAPAHAPLTQRSSTVHGSPS